MGHLLLSLVVEYLTIRGDSFVYLTGVAFLLGHLLDLQLLGGDQTQGHHVRLECRRSSVVMSKDRLGEGVIGPQLTHMLVVNSGFLHAGRQARYNKQGTNKVQQGTNKVQTRYKQGTGTERKPCPS